MENGNKMLSHSDKRQLLHCARLAISHSLDHSALRIPSEISVNSNLQVSAGVFVTLHIKSHLRGCIGILNSALPLLDEVIRQARNSAFHDPRFEALTADEFNLIHISISVLTAPETIRNYQDIHIGEHGVILKKAGRSAIFLPKVPVEQNWSLEETLHHLSLKAGLPENAWKKDCEFLVFKSIDFEE